MTVLVLALIGGTTAAFTITEALKLEPTPITAKRAEELFSPGCGCPTAIARLSMRIRRNDRLDLDILAGGVPIRNLARDLEAKKGRVHVRWDGRDDAGRIVPDGSYRLRVHLRDDDRTVVIPRTVRVDTESPDFEVLGVDRQVFSPDDDGRGDSIRIGYDSSEDGAAVVFVNGRLAAEGAFKPAGEADIAWDGQVDGRAVRAGDYTLFLRVRDAAGNLSAPGKVAVAVRYIVVVQSTRAVRRGGNVRFRVVTDASRFSWELRRVGGGILGSEARERPGVVVARVPEGARAGRYVLEVEANGHRDRAVVRVLRRG